MVNKAKRVAVAMSGGADSSVAATILKDRHFEVVGVTMRFDFNQQALSDARRVARILGIRHYAIDASGILNDKIMDNFVHEYLAGRTPNPCVLCNHFIKFGVLLEQVRSWGCSFLATGHYVRKIKSEEAFLLSKGRDKDKDQSYFLYRLSQNQLKYLLFPLGNLTKQQVVGIARRLKLSVIQRRESQEICFLSGRDYREFLKERIAAKIKPGDVIDSRGNILGRHEGIPFYTVGQREGLNIALGHRAYVIKTDALKNQIVLGTLRDVYGREFTVVRPNFILRSIKKRIVCKVKIRYNHKEAEAEVLPRGRNFKVTFRHAQFAITPGQSAVFYDHNTVIGGGIIR